MVAISAKQPPNFELAQTIPNAAEKINAFTDVERLRIAQRLIAFKNKNPGSNISVAIYEEFARQHSTRILTSKNHLWPGIRKVEHWSGINRIADRFEHLGGEFHEWYQMWYPQMSWYVHAGIVGVGGFSEEVFLSVCGIALDLAGKAYCRVLKQVIAAFHIAKADNKVSALLDFSRMVAFADDEAQARLLYDELLN